MDLERTREAYDKVAKDEIGRLGIAQELPRKKFAPVDGMGGVTLSHASTATVSHWIIWWVSTGHGDSNKRKKKHCNWRRAACGGQYEWGAPNRTLVVQLGANANEAKAFKAHAAPLGLCDNLINALKLQANQQKDGDSPIQSIV